MMRKWKWNYREHLPVIVSLLFIVILLLLPTGFEQAGNYAGTDRCRAVVLQTDESHVFSSGLIKSGEQTCWLRIENGPFKGREVEGVNMLSGSLENDKIFVSGDTAMVLVSSRNGEIISASMIDHYRIHKELLLAGIFVLLLVLFAGKTGVRSILSFILTILMIWKILVPGLLRGVNPVLAGLGITICLSVLIITLVYGFDRRSASAVSGSVLGILTTALLGVIFTKNFQIHGSVMAHSESLLYNGYEYLNLTNIFTASIFIGASGAVMDLAVDITSSIHEVVLKKPDISWREAAMSGIRVGRAAMGTMTTTLLLAYSGGYIALLMVFMAQGTPVSNILNYKYISAEILDTIIGSIGLVTVAPFTALAGGFLLTRRPVSANTPLSKKPK